MCVHARLRFASKRVAITPAKAWGTNGRDPSMPEMEERQME
jgi:hypothetical protein